MNPARMVELELPVCHNDSGRAMTEVLAALPLGPNRFRLAYSPGVVEGMAKGDVFELRPTDPKGFHVLERAGNLCVWFYFREAGANRGPDGERVRAAVGAFGGDCDGGGNTNLVFSVPVSLGFPAVESLFNALVGQYPGSSWLFGNVYDPWNGFEPLGWWEESK